MTLWKIIVVGVGLLMLRRMIKGFPSWDVPLSDGRVIRVLAARRNRHLTTARAGAPTGEDTPRFDVTFVGDTMSPADRVAAMPELAAWAAARPDSSGYECVFVVAAVRVRDSRIFRSFRHAEWQEFRRLPDGGVELVREGRSGALIYPGKPTDRSRPNG